MSVIKRGEFHIPRVLLIPSIAGKNKYRIPVGDFFRDAADVTTLEIDSGNGFNMQALGLDYEHLRRFTPPATVADAAIGFNLLEGPIPGGWTFRFQWTDRRILIEPGSIAKVLLPADYTNMWQANGTFAPNGVLIPEVPGMQCEFWRQTPRDGGARGLHGALHREGRRYVPFYRGATDVFRFSSLDFSSSKPFRRNHFRVCYYDPETGARSPLSRDVIVVCSTKQHDRVNGHKQRQLGSVWIE